MLPLNYACVSCECLCACACTRCRAAQRGGGAVGSRETVVIMPLKRGLTPGTQGPSSRAEPSCSPEPADTISSPPPSQPEWWGWRAGCRGSAGGGWWTGGGGGKWMGSVLNGKLTSIPHGTFFFFPPACVPFIGGPTGAARTADCGRGGRTGGGFVV